MSDNTTEPPESADADRHDADRQNAETHNTGAHNADVPNPNPRTTDDRIAAMQQVRGIQFGAGSLYSAMHRAYSLPVGTEERELAALALHVQVTDFLSLQGNDPELALLALGRIATEVSLAIGSRLGLDHESIGAQVDQHVLALQLGR